MAFFVSPCLEETPLAFITPYFDQIVAVIVMVFMLPESIKVLWGAVKDIFLFSPDQSCIEEVKSFCNPVLEKYQFFPVFFDITKTGRHLWVAVYFQIKTGNLKVQDLDDVLRLSIKSTGIFSRLYLRTNPGALSVLFCTFVFISSQISFTTQKSGNLQRVYLL